MSDMKAAEWLESNSFFVDGIFLDEDDKLVRFEVAQQYGDMLIEEFEEANTCKQRIVFNYEDCNIVECCSCGNTQYSKTKFCPECGKRVTDYV